MNLQEFKASLSGDTPPVGVSPLLQALWQEAKGNWEAAHGLAQRQNDREGAWVHAYLHRQEGDLPNAGYWYSRAGRPVSVASLEQEWEELVTALLAA
jgi:hypothetical protein